MRRWKKVLAVVLTMILMSSNVTVAFASEGEGADTESAAVMMAAQDTEEKTETVSEEKVQAEPKTQTEPEIQAEPEMKAEPEVQAEPEVKAEPEEKAESEVKADESVPEEESKTVDESAVEPASESDPEEIAEEEMEESEQENEEAKTQFSYEDSRVRITATATKEANLPQNAQLKAKYLPEGSGAYAKAVNAVTTQMETEKKEFLDFVCYDVYFEADGVEIEPEAGSVKVTMTYKQPQFKDVADEATEYATYHIVDGTNKVEDVTGNVNTNGAGAVTSM